MTAEQQTMYTILMWAMPIMMGIIAFVGALGVKALMKMANDLSEIKSEVKVLVTKHDEHDRRIDKLEEICEHR
jgi:hypothetical protein